MKDDGTGGNAIAGDGIYSGVVPGKGSGVLVAFYVTAEDNAGVSATSVFPEGAPGKECLVRFGESVATGDFGTYRMWMTQAVLNEWTTRHTRSNEPLDITLVYDDFRAVYNAGGRFRGGWRGFGSPVNNGAYSIVLPKSARVLGADELKIDQAGQGGGDSTRQRERHCAWIARQLGLPYSYLRFVNMFVNGNHRTLLHDIHTPAPDFVEGLNPDDGNPQIFKMYRDRPYSPSPFSNLTTVGGVKDKAAYRWYWRKKRTPVPDDDFSPLYPIVDAFLTVDADLYDARVKALLDVEECMGYFAVNHMVGNGDSYGYENAHNVVVYVPPDSGAMYFLYDLDFSLGNGAGSNSEILGSGDGIVYRMVTHPPFRRTYWRHVYNAATGPLMSDRGGPMLDSIYAVFQANGLPASSPSGIKSWINDRRNFILGQLSAVTSPLFAISTDAFAAGMSPVTVAGSAPIQVEAILVGTNAHRVKCDGVD